MRRWIDALLLPPLNCLLLALSGWAVGRRWPRLGRALRISAFVLLWLLCTPAIAGLMLQALQSDPALDPDALPGAEAIVVLSADRDREAPEYGAVTVGAMALQRVRYAAWLHQRSKLPVLVSGGVIGEGMPSLASGMRDVLEGQFGTPVRWHEERSRNTWENAKFSADLLRPHGVRRVYLVTHAWHMPRARASFEAQGLEVVAAPTAFRGAAFTGLRSLVPSWGAMRDSALALHEVCGRIWYELAHF